ncbi:hypothetical protein [Arthrobacter sp. A2-55]|uniref:hypothetical protein n=1 Tax=Arthrobacter sp. A2-55 TaxID=2897337 RepID=UPI0021CD2C3C|nr:hypothetical protein [Arthrobacter sp. A2-55]MCU6479094.1 hypothetical protein [Arthrobacter sp. A2-55]
MKQKPAARQPRGVTTGGQFAAKRQSESSVALPAPGASAPRLDTVADVRQAATSPDPLVRAGAAGSPLIPDDVLEALSQPEQPASVRIAAARTGYANTANRAAADRNPIIRALAATGWDLSDSNRQRLKNDAKVQQFMVQVAV